MMKRRLVSVLSLVGAAALLPVAAFSELGNLNMPLPFEVAIPNILSGLDITLQGLYLQPSASDAGQKTYVAYSFGPLSPPLMVTNVAVAAPEPGHQLGFLIGLGYTFPETGEDVRAEWSHLQKTADGSVSLTPISDQFINVQPPAGSSINFNTPEQNFQATTTTTDHYDAIDLNVGQYINMGNRLVTRLFAGLRLARIEHDEDVTYTGTGATGPNFTGPFEQTYSVTSHFTGLGPMGGASVIYDFCYGFGVSGVFDLGVLVGTTDNSNDYTRINIDNGMEVSDGQFSSGTESRTITVPFFDAKLGANYTMLFSGACRLRFDAGYQVTQYIDISDTLFYLEADTATLQNPTTMSYSGLYFGLNLKV